MNSTYFFLLKKGGEGMADKEVKVTIKAVDEASSTIKNVAEQLKRLGNIPGLSNLSKLGNTISNAFSGVQSKAGLAVAGITSVVAGFSKLYSASKQSFVDGISKIGNICKMALSGVASLGSGFIGLVEKVTGADLSFTGLVKSALDYEQQMKNVQVITNASGKDFADLQAKAQELGRNTSFTAGQIAEGMKEMAQQGWKAKDILTGMNAVTALAVVGNMKLSESSYLVASALNQFGANASEADRYANVMTNTFLNSGATVKNFGESLKYCGSLAGSMKIPIEDVGVAIGVLADNGIKGSQAGTTLRRVISNLVNPTDQVAAAIEKYNLQGARQKIINGDLVGGLKEMASKMKGLNSEQKAQAGYSIAGMYALSGFLALVNASPKELDKLYNSIKNGNGAYKTMEKTLNTVIGQMLLFVSKVQTGAKQIYDAIQTNIVGAMKTLNKFTDCLLDGNISGAFKFLANESKNWGKAIADGLSNAINHVNKFVNGGSLKSVLQIGTNIIQGICKGIDSAYKSGNLTNTISGFIRQICDFITKNAPAVEKAGKQIIDAVKQGIENNKDQINKALDSIISVMNTWAQGSADLQSICGTFASKLIDGFIEQIGIKARGKGTELWNAISSSLFDFSGKEAPTTALDFIDKLFGFGNDKAPETVFGKIGNWIKDYFCGEAFAGEVENAGQKTTESLNRGMDKGKEGTKQTADAIGKIFGVGVVEAIQQSQAQLQTAFTTIQNSARTAFTGMAGIVRTQFTNVTNIMRNQMVNCSNIVRNQAVNMSNIFRNQFVNMANIVRNQFTSVANIVRNQMVNCANIVRNQVVSMSNIFRNQFVNMANIVRNQFTNVANIVRNQMVNCANICRNQVVSMTNIFRNQFVSMANIVRSQFTNVSNIIRNQMVNCSNIVRNQAVNMSNVFRNQFVNMANICRNQFVNVANIIRNQMVSCANVVRTQAVNMSNIFRNQFVSMANVARSQMTNVSNIIRNQATSWGNVIRNQVTNARNAFTQQFISMASVARTQMVNVSNIIRTQAVTWGNVIRNQVQNARNALTSSFISMASVARTQMVNISNIIRNQAVSWANVIRNQAANCRSAMTSSFSSLSSVASSAMARVLAVVRSYMAQIRATVSQQMTMNFKVNKTITTTNVTKTKKVTAGLMSTMAGISRNTMSIGQPATIGNSARGNSGYGKESEGGNYTFSIPLYVDGREIARATASYNKAELSKLEKRNKRKRGE